MNSLLSLVQKRAESNVKPQDENPFKCTGTGLRGGAVFLFAVCLTAPVWAQSSTSPLEILKSAPTVRLQDEPAPTPVTTPPPQPAVNYGYTPPVQQQPPPYVPPHGPAPPIETVYPAITPYAGASTIGPQRGPAYTPAQPSGMLPGPTPRPILGPEDVDRDERKRGGIVRGLMRVIPFVGGDDEDEVQETPVPVIPPAPPVYRGLETPDPHGTGQTVDDAGNLLYAPGRSSMPGDPQPSSPAMRDLEEGNMPASPPIMTPEPRYPQPVDEPVDLDRQDSVRGPQPTTNSPLLTVRREGDPAPEADSSPEVTTGSALEAQMTPAAPPAETPIPLERATTSVLVQESRPRAAVEDSDIGPAPASTATRLDAFDPTAPAPSTVEPPPLADTVQSDEITSLTIEQSDLGMPNPAYEENTAVLANFQAAVRLARETNYSAAAKAFRDYARNHPSSGLAPRAAFLSVIFENSRSRALENFRHLESQFPDSRYVAEARKRREKDIVQNTPAAAAAEPVSDTLEDPIPAAIANAPPEVAAETLRQRANRFQRELTAAVGDPLREPVLRKNLGEIYLELEDFNAAYEVLRPAAEMAQGQTVNGQVMIALGRSMLGRGETVQAISLFDSVEENHPELIESTPESAWAAGLAYEGIGRYTKARSLYSLIRQKFPDSRQAQWATARLNELSALHR